MENKNILIPTPHGAGKHNASLFVKTSQVVRCGRSFRFHRCFKFRKIGAIKSVFVGQLSELSRNARGFPLEYVILFVDAKRR